MGGGEGEGAHSCTYALRAEEGAIAPASKCIIWQNFAPYLPDPPDAAPDLYLGRLGQSSALVV